MLTKINDIFYIDLDQILFVVKNNEADEMIIYFKNEGMIPLNLKQYEIFIKKLDEYLNGN